MQLRLNLESSFHQDPSARLKLFFCEKLKSQEKPRRGEIWGKFKILGARERNGSIDHQEVFLLAGAIARHGAHRRTRTLLAGRTAHLLDRHTHAHAHAPAWPHLAHHYLPAPLAAPAADPQNHLLPPISPTHRSAVTV